MITILKIIGVVGVLLGITSFMPEVVPVGQCPDSVEGCTTLPATLENGMEFFVNTISGILDLLPFLEVVWNLIMLALVVKVSLFTWSWLRWLIERL